MNNGIRTFNLKFMPGAGIYYGPENTHLCLLQIKRLLRVTEPPAQLKVSLSQRRRRGFSKLIVSEKQCVSDACYVSGRKLREAILVKGSAKVAQECAEVWGNTFWFQIKAI